MERIAVNSNAEAARRAAQEPNAAAVASNLAADIYELSCVAANIEDRSDNSTRFLSSAAKTLNRAATTKLRYSFQAAMNPGSLYQLLQPFYQAGISLTRIETAQHAAVFGAMCSLSTLKAINYEPRIKTAMDRVQRVATDFKWLGSYPKAVL